MLTTSLSLDALLPLTCSRAGTCCHGNLVRLNPWELARLAHEKQLPSPEFRAQFTDAGGAVLRFKGPKNNFGKQACGLYDAELGCSVHTARPLACRLFPLGRMIQNETVEYMHQGSVFPCLNECPEVVELPQLTVAEYLQVQATADFENAQDAYLEVMQNMADVALTLLLETSLVQRPEFQALSAWKQLGKTSPDTLSNTIGEEWMQRLMLPNLTIDSLDSGAFIQNHNECLMQEVQVLCDQLSTIQATFEASNLMMALALYLAHALGADAAGLSEWWIQIAKENGAEA